MVLVAHAAKNLPADQQQIPAKKSTSQSQLVPAVATKSIILGAGLTPVGRATLPVTFGTRDNYRTEYINFEVAEFETSYHAILGRPSLAKFMAIPNHTYLLLKMPAPKGVLSVYGDLQTSYACEAKNIELSDTLE